MFAPPRNSLLIETESGPPWKSQPTFVPLSRFLRVRFDQSFLHSGDNFRFFFAGHGKRHRDRDNLMPIDANPGNIEGTAISINFSDLFTSPLVAKTVDRPPADYWGKSLVALIQPPICAINSPGWAMHFQEPVMQQREVHNAKTAHFFCRFIPSQCPFERDIRCFGCVLLHIPPMCKLNPFYEQLVGLRFKVLCYLADVCGEDIAADCESIPLTNSKT